AMSGARPPDVPVGNCRIENGALQWKGRFECSRLQIEAAHASPLALGTRHPDLAAVDKQLRSRRVFELSNHPDHVLRVANHEGARIEDVDPAPARWMTHRRISGPADERHECSWESDNVEHE